MMGIRAPVPTWNNVLWALGHIRGLPTPVRPVHHLLACCAIVSKVSFFRSLS
jgi:hypothetical protein